MVLSNRKFFLILLLDILLFAYYVFSKLSYYSLPSLSLFSDTIVMLASFCFWFWRVGEDIVDSTSIFMEDISEAPSGKKSGKCPEYSMKLLAAMFSCWLSLVKVEELSEKETDWESTMSCFDWLPNIAEDSLLKMMELVESDETLNVIFCSVALPMVMDDDFSLQTLDFIGFGKHRSWYTFSLNETKITTTAMILTRLFPKPLLFYAIPAWIDSFLEDSTSRWIFQDIHTFVQVFSNFVGT